jgi:hypothetical protein
LIASAKSTTSNRAGTGAAFAQWLAEVTGGPVPRFEKADREPPADGVVIEGDDL